MSAVMTGALAALHERAIASSDDRPTWLRARQMGITATGIAKLMRGGPGEVRRQIEEKLSTAEDTDRLGNVKRIRWGRLREEEIANDIQARTNIRPSSALFYAVDNRRHLATPDGVGVDFDDNLLVSEVKTTMHNLLPGPLDGYTLQMHLVDDVWRAKPFWAEHDYYDQMQWEMHVTGAVKARFTWEQHDNDWSGWPHRGPAPLIPEWCWIPRDDFRIDQLIAVADAFLEALDVARAALDAGEGPVIDDEIDTHAVNYLRFLEAEGEASKAKKREWDALLTLLAGHATFSQVSALARVTWTRGGTVDGPTTTVDQVVVDEDAARAAFPDVFADLQKANTSVLRANQRHAKAQAAVDEVFARFTRTEPVTVTEKVTTKQNLRVTSVNPKGKK